MRQTGETDIQGQFSTAEVTHILEGLKLEGMCYLKNHFFMEASDEAKQPVREWHDNVTRRNLDALQGIAREMGVNLPFPTKLEDRENQLKDKMRGAKQQIANVFTPGEVLLDVRTAAVHLNEYYTISMDLATSERVRETFRRNREIVTENMPKIEQALKESTMFYPPPVAKRIGYVAEKGVAPSGAAGGGRAAESGQTTGATRRS